MIKSRYLTGLLGLSLSLTGLLAACGPGGTGTPTPAVSYTHLTLPTNSRV